MKGPSSPHSCKLQNTQTQHRISGSQRNATLGIAFFPLPVVSLLLLLLAARLSAPFAVPPSVALAMVRNAHAAGTAIVLHARDYGAAGDNRTVDTHALQRAFDACPRSISSRTQTAAQTRARCVIVLDAPGVYLSGSLEVRRHNLTLLVAPGATLQGSPEPAMYPLVPPLPSYGSGRDNARNTSVRHMALLFGKDVQGFELTGGGVVDGAGWEWWNRERNGTLQFSRPRILECLFCSNLTVRGVTLRNSAFWTLHPFACESVLVENTTILAPRDSPNTDGVDPDSSVGVVIRNNTIDCGDDAVAIKSGLDEWGRAFGRPSRDILVTQNRIWGKAIAIGSEMSGGVSDVLVTQNELGDPRGSVTGLLVKSAPGRGGTVSNVTFEHIRMHNLSRVYSWIPALIVSDHYGGKKFNHSTAPTLRDIVMRNISIDYATQVGCLEGLPEKNLSGIVLENVTVGSFEQGWACDWANYRTSGVVQPQACRDPTIQCSFG